MLKSALLIISLLSMTDGSKSSGKLRYRLCEVQSDESLSMVTRSKNLSCPYSVRPNSIPSVHDLPIERGNWTIYVTGKPDDKKSFIIKLVYNPKCLSESSFIPLQITVDMETSKITRNTFAGGYWGTEETELKDGGFNFEGDKIFQMAIRTSGNHFDVSNNGQHLFEYEYRLPINSIKKIKFDGDIHIFSVTV